MEGFRRDLEAIRTGSGTEKAHSQELVSATQNGLDTSTDEDSRVDPTPCKDDGWSFLSVNGGARQRYILCTSIAVVQTRFCGERGGGLTFGRTDNSVVLNNGKLGACEDYHLAVVWFSCAQ